jgi:hypothetical protein
MKESFGTEQAGGSAPGLRACKQRSHVFLKSNPRASVGSSVWFSCTSATRSGDTKIKALPALNIQPFLGSSRCGVKWCLRRAVPLGLGVQSCLPNVVCFDMSLRLHHKRYISDFIALRQLAFLTFSRNFSMKTVLSLLHSFERLFVARAFTVLFPTSSATRQAVLRTCTSNRLITTG